MKVREGFVESEGHKLAYLAVNEHLTSNEEPAIVFIHGVLASVNFWLDCVPPEFKEGRAWYSLSLPAHHPSTVPANFKLGDVDEAWFFNIMNGALQALLGDKKAIVVGHSTGGFCALNLAINQARNVVGIISVAGFHKGKWGGVEGLLLKIAGLGKWTKNLFAANISISQSSYFVRRTFASLLAHNRKDYQDNPLSQRTLDNMEVNLLAQDPIALFKLFNGIATLDITDQLHRIDMPCYIFSGTHDPVVNKEQSQVLASRIPGAKSVVFQNVGHMPFIEDSDTYFNALMQALKGIIDTSIPKYSREYKNRKLSMNYPQYKKDLQRIHESEVYGLAVFDMAAQLTISKVKKEKWLALKALEQQTLDRYLDYMRESGQAVVTPRGWALKGRAEGAVLGLMPWRLAMKLVRDGTLPFQEKFLRLKDNANKENQSFFSYVYAHEKAIEAFAEKELSRDQSSLNAIKKLLG